LKYEFILNINDGTHIKSENREAFIPIIK